MNTLFHWTIFVSPDDIQIGEVLLYMSHKLHASMMVNIRKILRVSIRLIQN